MMQISAYGRLGKDPKFIQTASGKKMTAASLAVSLDLREGGETLDGTQWLNLVAFEKLADLLARHKQGELVNIFGRCQLSRYQGKDGETRETLTVVVDGLVSARTTRPGGGKRKAPKQDGQRRTGEAEPFQDDEISF
ncbi:MAG: single-stranded DNA-binding protein [Gammaproteobacteria bacterium]|nr:single-stranded DNA-binding protein [Gammaproteobacteria bacterium]MDE0510438.1 single-stranded DNA-binding protein [Gammaproteobacteria bacterium]